MKKIEPFWLGLAVSVSGSVGFIFGWMKFTTQLHVLEEKFIRYNDDT